MLVYSVTETVDISSSIVVLEICQPPSPKHWPSLQSWLRAWVALFKDTGEYGMSLGVQFIFPDVFQREA